LPSLLLHRGTLVIDEKVMDPVQIAVPGGYVLVQGDPQSGAECEMAAAGNSSSVSVKRGVAEIHGQGAPVILHSGQSSRLEAGQQGTQPVAGKIGKEIPEATTQHEGQTQEVSLVLNEVINWNDVVRTAQAGRALITLLDGSTLGVGLHSTVRVVKHDPQAQQTEIELTSGRLQASVQKITAPGGKFEVQTKSAVIGTSEGSFVVVADEKGTRACGVDGVTEIRSSDPNVTKQERLRRNMCAYVVPGGPPGEPVLAPSEVAGILNETVIEMGGHALPLKTVAEVAAAGGAAIAIAGIVLATSGTTSPTTP
jgi:ferric-dicitrate binding protein FerR (iron transport regulator)